MEELQPTYNFSSIEPEWQKEKLGQLLSNSFFQLDTKKMETLPSQEPKFH